jgi:hypothetical protein
MASLEKKPGPMKFETKERIMLVGCVPYLPAFALPASMAALTKSICNAMQRIAPLRLAGSWDNVRANPNSHPTRVSFAGKPRSDFS